MKIEKVWINRKGKGHNFIIYDGNTIYRKKASKEEFGKIEKEIAQGIINKKIIGIPISYLREVEFREDDQKIKLEYGKDSEDEIHVEDLKMRREIFDYLKENTPVRDFRKEKPSILRRIKGPLLALLVVIGIFAYVLSIIDGMQMGYEYEIVGNRPGLAGIVLIFAQLGFWKNAMVFIPLSIIAIYRINRNYQNDSEIHRLAY